MRGNGEASHAPWGRGGMRRVEGGGHMATKRERRSEAQRWALAALAADGARIVPNVSANWYVMRGPQILATVRWETVQAKAGHIARSGHEVAYRITDAARASAGAAGCAALDGAHLPARGRSRRLARDRLKHRALDRLMDRQRLALRPGRREAGFTQRCARPQEGLVIAFCSVGGCGSPLRS